MPYVRVYVKSKEGLFDTEPLAAQSPIPIVLSETTRLRPPVHLCYCNYFDRRDTTVSVINDGYAVKVTLPRILKDPTIKCGPLKHEYVFEKVVFHWGESNDEGSEHSIDGQRFACELQLYHYNNKYGSFDDAKDKTDGLLAVAIMVSCCEQTNNRFNELIDAIFRVPCRHTEYTYTTRCFFEWMEKIDLNEYVMYPGSLTSEPYTENVKWIVICKPTYMSCEQLTAFKYVHIYQSRTRIKTNVRDLQTPPEGLEIEYTGDLRPKIREIFDDDTTTYNSISTPPSTLYSPTTTTTTGASVTDESATEEVPKNKEESASSSD